MDGPNLAAWLIPEIRGIGAVEQRCLLKNARSQFKVEHGFASKLPTVFAVLGGGCAWLSGFFYSPLSGHPGSPEFNEHLGTAIVLTVVVTTSAAIIFGFFGEWVMLRRMRPYVRHELGRAAERARI